MTNSTWKYSFFFWSFPISCGVTFGLELSDFLWRGKTPQFFFSLRRAVKTPHFPPVSQTLTTVVTVWANVSNKLLNSLEMLNSLVTPMVTVAQKPKFPRFSEFPGWIPWIPSRLAEWSPDCHHSCSGFLKTLSENLKWPRKVECHGTVVAPVFGAELTKAEWPRPPRMSSNLRMASNS